MEWSEIVLFLCLVGQETVHVEDVNFEQGDQQINLFFSHSYVFHHKTGLICKKINLKHLQEREAVCREMDLTWKNIFGFNSSWFGSCPMFICDKYPLKFSEEALLSREERIWRVTMGGALSLCGWAPTVGGASSHLRFVNSQFPCFVNSHSLSLFSVRSYL